jgi:hypothetical protein
MTEPDKTARYRETIDLLSDDHRTFTSRMLGDDGNLQELMTAQYRRMR